jgi:hypothetical protein
MAFNHAFLLERGRQRDFRARVESLNAKYSGQGLVLELSGPWPPYNFCPPLRPASAETTHVP